MTIGAAELTVEVGEMTSDFDARLDEMSERLQRTGEALIKYMYIDVTHDQKGTTVYIDGTEQKPYSHRNGETEPPTEAGWYWFVGRKRKHPRRVRRAGVYQVWWNAGELCTSIAPWSPCLVEELDGQWWGPLTSPWE